MEDIEGSIPSSLDAQDVGLINSLVSSLGQKHLFEGWVQKDGGISDQNKVKMMEQLKKLNGNYPGGLEAYVSKAKDLLGKSKRGENPFEGYTPHVPINTKFPFSSKDEELRAAEATGKEAFKKCACILVAGGLGERLGYSGIKVELPSEMSSKTCFLGLYCNFIRALQGDDHLVPLAIMTSDDTHDKTVQLLERENYFGLQKDQIILMKQEKVASLIDDQAKIALKDDGHTILTKPHGHGDVHLLLHQNGLAQKWASEGKEWLLFFQDTNPMSFRTMMAALGVSKTQDLMVNSVAFPRKAKAAAGAIMRLVHEDGHEVTINVEYNYIDSVLRSTINPENGDINGPDGYSMFPGNTNQLVFKLDPYVKALTQTGGIVPEFVNPKYKNEERTIFKSPTRLECMMQDFPLMLKDVPGARIGVTVFNDAQYEKKSLEKSSLTHRLYAPAKNNLKDARAKFEKGIPDASTTSTELAIYACNSIMLKDLGCNIQDPAISSYGGIEQPEWPHIVLLPRFLPLYSEAHLRFKQPQNVSISQRSTLVIDGDITFTGEFELDGALILRADPGVVVTVDKVVVKNAGLPFVPVDPEDETQDEIDRIRGFRVANKSAESDKNVLIRTFSSNETDVAIISQ